MKLLSILICLSIFCFKGNEISIWSNEEYKNFEVYESGKKVYLLNNSTPKNRRFCTNKNKLDLMLISETDTCYMSVMIIEKRTVLSACF